MSRRRWLRAAGGSGLVLLAGTGAGAAWLAGERPPVAIFPDVPDVLAWLHRLAREPARSTTAWPLAQVLEHLAQSVEYSFAEGGYPQPRSDSFRATLGPLAFRAFARRGAMSHGTTEPIPGAPPLAADDVPAAARRLGAALMRFESRPPGFVYAPHFAYGALGKDDYRRAHLMHAADHAREVVFG